MEKLIITCAPVGSITTRRHTPYLPITPEEIINASYEAYLAGASIIHVHVRDKEGNASADPVLIKEVMDGIREKCDVIINLSSAAKSGSTAEEKLRIVELCPEMATFNAGSMNIGSRVFVNPPPFLEELAQKMQALNVKPEIEIFDSGMIGNAMRVFEKGYLTAPLHFQFVLGIQGGMEATPENLLYLTSKIPPGSTWSAIGAGKAQLAINTMSILLGGHVRVGMEDSVYLYKGVLAKSNAEFVERIVRLANLLGREVATPDEARRILGIQKKGLS